MENSTIPLLTAITILGIITLLFFVNEFFRKYKVVKKQKSREQEHVQHPANIMLGNISYASRVANAVSSYKKEMDSIPKDISKNAKIIWANEIAYRYKLKISKIK